MEMKPITKSKLWSRINDLCREEKIIMSLTGISWHTIESTNSPNVVERNKYNIRYKSGGAAEVNFQLVCELYNLLWSRLESSRCLTDKEMKHGGYDKLGWERWYTPGSAMLAIIPYLDSRVRVTNNPAGLKI